MFCYEPSFGFSLQPTHNHTNNLRKYAFHKFITQIAHFQRVACQFNAQTVPTPWATLCYFDPYPLFVCVFGLALRVIRPYTRFSTKPPRSKNPYSKNSHNKNPYSKNSPNKLYIVELHTEISSFESKTPTNPRTTTFIVHFSLKICITPRVLIPLVSNCCITQFSIKVLGVMK